MSTVVIHRTDNAPKIKQATSNTVDQAIMISRLSGSYILVGSSDGSSTEMYVGL